jgi:hypothetical protein
MKRFLGTILVIIFFAACGKSRPKGIFSEKKMTDILFDIHLAEGYISSLPVDSLKEKKTNYYLSIYQKYNTDSTQVKENLEYYAEHPQDLQDIYAEISKRLQSTEEGLNKRVEEKRISAFKLDSIRMQRTTDSLNLFKRDSLLHFNGGRDLFIHSKDSLKSSVKDSLANIKVLKDSLVKAKINTDSLSVLRIKDALRKSILNEQKKWELTFYYFNELKPASIIKPSSSTEPQNSPSSDSEKKKTDITKVN